MKIILHLKGAWEWREQDGKKLNLKVLLGLVISTLQQSQLGLKIKLSEKSTILKFANMFYLLKNDSDN
jgi:hypothetical protein